MRKIAAHYVFCRQLCRMSYVELDHQNRFRGIQPLQEEIAGTEFYDGILVVVPDTIQLTHSLLENSIKQYNTSNLINLLELNEITNNVLLNDIVSVYLLRGFSLSTPELSTNNGRCNCYIERL